MQNTEKLKFVLRFVLKKNIVFGRSFSTMWYKKYGPAMHQATISTFGLGGGNRPVNAIKIHVRL